MRNSTIFNGMPALPSKMVEQRQNDPNLSKVDDRKRIREWSNLF